MCVLTILPMRLRYMFVQCDMFFHISAVHVLAMLFLAVSLLSDFLTIPSFNVYVCSRYVLVILEPCVLTLVFLLRS
jgi:hypothetical protein